jgi:hypothetical protein
MKLRLVFTRLTDKVNGIFCHSKYFIRLLFNEKQQNDSKTE